MKEKVNDKGLIPFEILEDEIYVVESSVTYCQFKGAEQIKFLAKDDGAGVFFSIQTDEFNFDNVEELTNLANDFFKRF